jgi:hypothetical protein
MSSRHSFAFSGFEWFNLISALIGLISSGLSLWTMNGAPLPMSGSAALGRWLILFFGITYGSILASYFAHALIPTTRHRDNAAGIITGMIGFPLYLAYFLYLLQAWVRSPWLITAFTSPRKGPPDPNAVVVYTAGHGFMISVALAGLFSCVAVLAGSYLHKAFDSD